MVSRREFIRSGALALAGGATGLLPHLFAGVRSARADAGGAATDLGANAPVLVAIFQRGAMDGLMAVPPFRDRGLRVLRPRLAMDAADADGAIVEHGAWRPAGDGADQRSAVGLVDLDGRFALHGALGALAPAFAAGELAVVHGVGSPVSTRSHFDAQDFMETGTPGVRRTESGWLNRVAAMRAAGGAVSSLQAVSLTTALPRSLHGDHPTLAIGDLGDFGVGTERARRRATLPFADGFESLYAATTQELLADAAHESFDALSSLDDIDPAAYVPANGARYPRSKLGGSLRQIAQLIKADVGVEIAFAETDGWDTHVQQGRRNGGFARRASDLAGAMAALWTDLGETRQRTVVMTMTEFGRTVHENGSGGTDHGRASCSFVLGRHVRGGHVHGVVPPLEREELEDGRDLPVTTDFRQLFHAVAAAHLGVDQPGVLFPGWQPSASLSLFGDR